MVVSLEFGGLRAALRRVGYGSEEGGWRRSGAALGCGCGAAMMARGAVVVFLAVLEVVGGGVRCRVLGRRGW